MRYAPFYSNEMLCRMEAIFERVCVDLGVAGSSDYACSAREVLARLMFEMPPPGGGLLQPAATRLRDLAIGRRLFQFRTVPIE